jgi:hypothetical protein
MDYHQYGERGGRMEEVAINLVLGLLEEYRWGWRTPLPNVRFFNKPVYLRVDTQPIPTGGPSPPLDAEETALVRLVLEHLPGLLPEIERHYRSHADSPDIIERLHEPSVWLSRDILSEEGPDHWCFVVGITDAPDWTICAEFTGLAFQVIWSGD